MLKHTEYSTRVWWRIMKTYCSDCNQFLDFANYSPLFPNGNMTFKCKFEKIAHCFSGLIIIIKNLHRKTLSSFVHLQWMKKKNSNECQMLMQIICFWNQSLVLLQCSNYGVNTDMNYCHLKPSWVLIIVIKGKSEK